MSWFLIWVGSALLVLAVSTAEPAQFVVACYLLIAGVAWKVHTSPHPSAAKEDDACAPAPSSPRETVSSPLVSGGDGSAWGSARPFRNMRRIP